MNRFGNERDMTGRQHAVTPTPAPTLAWLCGHFAPRLGGQLRAGLLWRCGRCAAARATNEATQA